MNNIQSSKNTFNSALTLYLQLKSFLSMLIYSYAFQLEQTTNRIVFEKKKNVRKDGILCWALLCPLEPKGQVQGHQPGITLHQRIVSLILEHLLVAEQ